ncbi:indole-3-glycerol phosphate synthase [Coprinopsis marcescibilis]|uniref:indole-3-glycerol-phosphate synthase n=1 Tax=Coprinopsis marcescibilis TaxID=230819 RepID=A0A5C3KTT2_COPMA|nr:indole-3-glycerol phosphate synthase [Coprinopsis marcescibilis]TFK24132.1 indole-3-glycerol phosphate synthase [Coprinopsis marcescibilis]
MSNETEPAKPSILSQMYEQRMKDIQADKIIPGSTPLDIQRLLNLSTAPPLISFVERLERNPSSLTPNPRPSLIAEIKRVIAHKGEVSPVPRPAALAHHFVGQGASAISVLTEPRWFKGSLLDLRGIREAVTDYPDRPAIIAKDLVFDEYQIDVARLNGADTVSLIVALLSQERLKALYDYSLSHGMEPLVKVHNSDEMTRAIDIGAKVIGIYNHNPHDFSVNLATTLKLAGMVNNHDDTLLCAIGGITTAAEVETYAQQGVKVILIEEDLKGDDGQPRPFFDDLPCTHAMEDIVDIFS